MADDHASENLGRVEITSTCVTLDIKYIYLLITINLFSFSFFGGVKKWPICNLQTRI